jgi:hypothetical protein
MDARFAKFSGSLYTPVPTLESVTVEAEDWAPKICLVYQDACTHYLSLALGSSELQNFTPQVWVAGDPVSTVTLQWDVWDGQIGWRQSGGTVDTQPQTTGIDPEGTIPSSLESIALPFKDNKGQAVLYAVRTYTRSADQTERTVRSNPVLINVYES